MDKTPITDKELRIKIGIIVNDYGANFARVAKHIAEEEKLNLSDSINEIWTLVKPYYIEKGRQMERERVLGIIENLSSIGYPYGEGYKRAIQQALKEGNDV